ncbi:MAG TPA: hypothetical protein VMT35_20010 [Ignavibacteriaceae bacterium]|nr:hypothetical protein [Ignavibacteriaceae bacterium]
MRKMNLFFVLLIGLAMSPASSPAAQLQNITIAYTFKNGDGTVFRIIKYYLADNNKFRTEYYSTVEYNINADAQAMTNDSGVSSGTHAEMKSEPKTDTGPQTIEILRKDKRLVWSIDPAFKNYIEVPLKEDSWGYALMNIFVDSMGDLKKSGETKLLDYPCIIWKSEQKENEDNWTSIFYVAQDINVVLKTEIRQNGKLVQTMEATEFKLEKPSESLFEVPGGYKKNENR